MKEARRSPGVILYRPRLAGKIALRHRDRLHRLAPRPSCERHGLPEMAINLRETAGTAQLARCRYIVLFDEVERRPDLG